MSTYNGDEIKGLDEYINFGGLPFVATLKTIEEKIDYLNFQKNNVYINDVIERNDIRNDEELKILICLHDKHLQHDVANIKIGKEH